MSPSKSIAVVAFLCMLAVSLSSCSRPQSKHVETLHLLQGSTMGTTYTVRFLPELGSPSRQEMHRLIEEELKSVNQQMSTYIEDSEIMRFNVSKSTDWFSVSLETAKVVDLSLQISVVSDGAFDVTVGPLVNLWGFGPVKRKNSIPTDTELEAAGAHVGYKNLSVRSTRPEEVGSGIASGSLGHCQRSRCRPSWQSHRDQRH